MDSIPEDVRDIIKTYSKELYEIELYNYLEKKGLNPPNDYTGCWQLLMRSNMKEMPIEIIDYYHLADNYDFEKSIYNNPITRAMSRWLSPIGLGPEDYCFMLFGRYTLARYIEEYLREKKDMMKLNMLSERGAYKFLKMKGFGCKNYRIKTLTCKCGFLQHFCDIWEPAYISLENIDDIQALKEYYTPYVKYNNKAFYPLVATKG